MDGNNYTKNKIEVNLSDVLEFTIKRKKEERQARRAAEAKALETVEETPQGEKLTWKVTPEQIAQINAGDRAALNAFYFDERNLERITFCAHRFMRHNRFLQTVVSSEDLTQQVYCDLLCGMAKLRPYDGAIWRTLYNSFRFAAVGGLDEIFIPKE